MENVLKAKIQMRNILNELWGLCGHKGTNVIGDEHPVSLGLERLIHGTYLM